MKTKERRRGRALRADGRPIGEIARLAGVSVSSVSRWVVDIELTDEQRKRLRQRPQIAVANRARALARHRLYQDEGRAAARAAHPLHHAGSMLYWAEGARSMNAHFFTNSDPAMVRLFVRFLRECLAIEDGRIRIDLRLYADHAAEQHQIEQYWLASADLPGGCLRTSTVNVYSKYSKRTRVNKLPYGTCRVAAHDTRVVQHILGAIQEYGGFERPEWLG